MGVEQVNKQNSLGRITSGIKLHASILSIISFMCEQLPLWRDDPNRVDEPSERKLNSQLSKFLDCQAREYFPMFRFDHEEPQQGNRSIDISVSPETKMVIEARTYTIYDPVLVIECKRLPAPSSERKKEYVTGQSPNKITGGIQRFKLGLHGAKHDLAAMVGYIQDQIDEGWIDTINKWIKELVAKPIGDGCVWSNDEILHLCEYNILTGVGKCKSKHWRSTNNRKIEIYHLWISMRRKSA
jgi:hypothetical protein